MTASFGAWSALTSHVAPDAAPSRVPYVFPIRRIQPRLASSVVANLLQIDVTSALRRHC